MGKVKTLTLKIDRCMGYGINIDSCPFYAETNGERHCIRRDVRCGIENALIPYELDHKNKEIITSIPDWCHLEDAEESE